MWILDKYPNYDRIGLFSGLGEQAVRISITLPVSPFENLQKNTS